MLFDRPQANKILESSGVNVKCQHLLPMGTSARSCRESAENTWSLPACAAETKMRLPARSNATPLGFAAVGTDLTTLKFGSILTNVPEPSIVTAYPLPSGETFRPRG